MDFNVLGTSGWVAGIGAFGGVVWPLILAAIHSGSGNIHLVFILFIIVGIIALICLAGVQVILKRDVRAAAERETSQGQALQAYGNGK